MTEGAHDIQVDRDAERGIIATEEAVPSGSTTTMTWPIHWLSATFVMAPAHVDCKL